MENLSDEKLIESYIKGESKALEILIKRYLTPVYNFILGYVKEVSAAEDVTQEVFVKVWKNLKKFKPEYKFKSWLYKIAKNTSLDYLKKNKAVTFSELDNFNDDSYLRCLLDEKSISPLEIASLSDNAGQLNLALEKLPEKYKSTLNMRYQQGLKFREIAEIMQESIDTIKTRHRRALIYLRKLIGK